MLDVQQVSKYAPRPPKESIFTKWFKNLDPHSVLDYQIFNFQACPGILHTEIHIFPAAIETLLKVISPRSPHYQKLERIYRNQERHLSSGNISTSYQGYFDLLKLMWNILIPIIETQVSKFSNIFLQKIISFL